MTKISEQIPTPHGDTLREQTNVKEKPNSNYLQKIEQIDGTPFDVIQAEEKYYGALGKYIITPEQKSTEDVLTFIEKNMWNVIMSCIAAYDIGKEMKIKEAIKNNKEQGL